MWTDDQLPLISKDVDNVLDSIGFSEEMRKFVVDMATITNMLQNIDISTLGYRDPHIVTGSSIEGTTNDLMNSDTDHLKFDPSIIVWKPGESPSRKTYLTMLKTESTPAGYTKLQLVYDNELVNTLPTILSKIPYSPLKSIEKDTIGNFVMTNKFTENTNMKYYDERHGPAETTNQVGDITALDVVRGFYCGYLPDELDQWFARTLSCTWPSRKTCKLFKKLGCFVVPVGHPESPEKDLEWRLSLSLQERYLMLNLTPTQYKCYILLKLIKKYWLKPKTGDIISSYHCKTALFYTIEKNSQDIWKTDHLITCLLLCLKQLLKWVTDGNCPNYFIPKENMFAAKLNKTSQSKLVCYLNQLIKNNCNALLDIEVCGFGKTLNRLILNSNIDTIKLDIHWSTDRARYLSKPKCVFDQLHKLFIKYASFIVGAPLREFETHVIYGKKNLKKTLAHIKDVSGRTKLLPLEMITWFLCNRTPQIPIEDCSLQHQAFFNDEHEKDMVIKAIDLAMTKVRSLLNSSKVAKQLIEKRQNINIRNEHLVNQFPEALKEAFVAYKQSMYTDCQKRLDEIVSIEKLTLYQCSCDQNCLPSPRLYRQYMASLKSEVITESFCKRSFTETGIFLAKKSFSGCLLFLTYEHDFLPVYLLYEAYRSFGTPSGSWDKTDDYWFSRVVVNPVIFLYYLQIKCYEKLGERIEANQALSKMENEIISNLNNRRYLGHLDTALNILGQIYITKGWNRLALECFRVSAAVRYPHNAAKFHVMHLTFGK